MDIHLPDAMLFAPAHLVVRESPINGRGLYTTRAVRAGEPLLIIAGELVAESEALRREREEANWYIYCHGETFIDTAQSATARYLNHSCAPNTTTVARDGATRYLIAIRDIAAGVELTLDYEYHEIYDLCQRLNAHCLHRACPRAGQGAHAATRISGDDQ